MKCQESRHTEIIRKEKKFQAEKENQCLNTIRRKMKMNKVNRQRPFGAKDKWSYAMGDLGCNMSLR